MFEQDPKIVDLIEAQRRVIEAQEQVALVIRDALAKGFDAIFNNHPVIHAVAWTQYTPYFNDGNECIFSSQITEAEPYSIEDYEAEDGVIGYEIGERFYKRMTKFHRKYATRQTSYGEAPDYNTWHDVPNPDYDPAYEAAYDDLRAFTSALGSGDFGKCPDWGTPSPLDNVMKSAFGDHARIIVVRDEVGVKFIIQELEHE